MYQNLPAYVAWQGHGKQGNHTPRLLANLSPVHIAKFPMGNKMLVWNQQNS